MKQITKSFLKKVLEIYGGWKVWHMCIKKYPIMRDGVIIVMPSCDDGFNSAVIKNLDTYLMQNKLNFAVLIVSDLSYGHIDYSLSRCIEHIEKFSSKKIENVMAYYAACFPGEKMVIADIDSFHVRKKLHKLIGVNGLTMEDIVKFGIYKLENDSRE